MKIKSLLFQLSALVVLCTVFTISSCKKEDSDTALTPEEEQQAAFASSESESQSDVIFNDVFDNVIGVNAEAGLGGTGIFGARTIEAAGVNAKVDSLHCAIVTVVRLTAGAAFPVRITIDFGTGCVGRDGRVRRGKIIAHYTGPLREIGSVAETTFDNFFVDSIKVEGTHRIKNTSTPPTSTTLPVRQFTVDITGGKLIHANGNYTTHNGHRVITQVEGMATPLIAIDDAFRITGHASGTVKRGSLIIGWESVIVDPLLKRFNCRWIVAGTVRVSRVNLTTDSKWRAVLNYGAGTCDNSATLTVGGTTHIISLR